jgi:hypothetical protein
VTLNLNERRRLRGLLKKAELDFHCPHCGARTPINSRLIEGSPALKKGKRGAPEKGKDEAALEGIEFMVRQLMRQLGLKRGPAILWLARALLDKRNKRNIPLRDAKGREIATSPEALADRWEQKLRKNGFNKRPLKTLAPRGVLIPLLKSGRIFPVSN